MANLYLEPHQARTTEPTAYENLLGDSIEHAFSSGIAELQGLADFLNEHGPGPQNVVDQWTAESLAAELHRLGAD